MSSELQLEPHEMVCEKSKKKIFFFFIFLIFLI